MARVGMGGERLLLIEAKARRAGSCPCSTPFMNAPAQASRPSKARTASARTVGVRRREAHRRGPHPSPPLRIARPRAISPDARVGRRSRSDQAEQARADPASSGRNSMSCRAAVGAGGVGPFSSRTVASSASAISAVYFVEALAPPPRRQVHERAAGFGAELGEECDQCPSSASSSATGRSLGQPRTRPWTIASVTCGHRLAKRREQPADGVGRARPGVVFRNPPHDLTHRPRGVDCRRRPRSPSGTQRRSRPRRP